jgi:hypothetical protein
MRSRAGGRARAGPGHRRHGSGGPSRQRGARLEVHNRKHLGALTVQRNPVAAGLVYGRVVKGHGTAPRESLQWNGQVEDRWQVQGKAARRQFLGADGLDTKVVVGAWLSRPRLASCWRQQYAIQFVLLRSESNALAVRTGGHDGPSAGRRTRLRLARDHDKGHTNVGDLLLGRWPGALRSGHRRSRLLRACRHGPRRPGAAEGSGGFARRRVAAQRERNEQRGADARGKPSRQNSRAQCAVTFPGPSFAN